MIDFLSASILLQNSAVCVDGKQWIDFMYLGT